MDHRELSLSEIDSALSRGGRRRGLVSHSGLVERPVAAAVEDAAEEASEVVPGPVGPVGPVVVVIVVVYGPVAVSVPLVAAVVVATVEAIAVAATIGTAACARRWRGAGLVGPLPQLTVLVPAALAH